MNLETKGRICQQLEKKVKELEGALSMTNEKRFKLQDTIGSMEKELQVTKAEISKISFDEQTWYGNKHIPFKNTNLGQQTTCTKALTKPTNSTLSLSNPEMHKVIVKSNDGLDQFTKLVFPMATKNDFIPLKRTFLSNPDYKSDQLMYNSEIDTWLTSYQNIGEIQNRLKFLKRAFKSLSKRMLHADDLSKAIPFSVLANYFAKSSKHNSMSSIDLKTHGMNKRNCSKLKNNFTRKNIMHDLRQYAIDSANNTIKTPSQSRLNTRISNCMLQFSNNINLSTNILKISGNHDALTTSNSKVNQSANNSGKSSGLHVTNIHTPNFPFINRQQPIIKFKNNSIKKVEKLMTNGFPTNALNTSQKNSLFVSKLTNTKLVKNPSCNFQNDLQLNTPRNSMNKINMINARQRLADEINFNKIQKQSNILNKKSYSKNIAAFYEHNRKHCSSSSSRRSNLNEFNQLEKRPASAIPLPSYNKRTRQQCPLCKIKSHIPNINAHSKEKNNLLYNKIERYTFPSNTSSHDNILQSQFQPFKNDTKSQRTCMPLYRNYVQCEAITQMRNQLNEENKMKKTMNENNIKQAQTPLTKLQTTNQFYSVVNKEDISLYNSQGSSTESTESNMTIATVRKCSKFINNVKNISHYINQKYKNDYVNNDKKEYVL